jgi:hypothetical protein
MVEQFHGAISRAGKSSELCKLQSLYRQHKNSTRNPARIREKVESEGTEFLLRTPAGNIKNPRMLGRDLAGMTGVVTEPARHPNDSHELTCTHGRPDKPLILPTGNALAIPS